MWHSRWLRSGANIDHPLLWYLYPGTHHISANCKTLQQSGEWVGM
jgi:hypothetical protein